MKNSRTWYIGLLLLVICSALVALIQYKISTDIPITPCSPEGYPARCYHIAEDVCNVVWENAEASCKEYIRKLSLPVGRLIGPIEFNCKVATLDQSFKWSRKSSPECDERIRNLDDWVARNNFK